jgi:hypothetical protein
VICCRDRNVPVVFYSGWNGTSHYLKISGHFHRKKPKNPQKISGKFTGKSYGLPFKFFSRICGEFALKICKERLT